MVNFFNRIVSHKELRKMKFNIAQVTFIAYLILFSILRSNCADDEECDKSKCPGPTAYYRNLGCKPIYETPDDCCPYKYNCDKVQSLNFDQCHADGHAYNMGEKLKEEDSQPCDIGCVCAAGYDGVARFNCSIVDCFRGPVKPGCYRKNSAYDCCPGEEICPENPEDRSTCDVDGKMYKDGEYFSVESDPNKICVCGPGYEGENVAPFCRNGSSNCRPLFRDPSNVKNNCSPVYYSSQSPQNSCNLIYRCQNRLDKVIKLSGSSTDNDDEFCRFGMLIMRYGDELNQGTDYSSVCVKCVCEVGPTPTCQRLPDNECDGDVTQVIMNHIKSIRLAIPKIKVKGGR